MKKYKFSELNQKATINAVIDYLDGYNGTREWGDDLSVLDAFDCCKDTENEVFYDEFGNVSSGDDYYVKERI